MSLDLSLWWKIQDFLIEVGGSPTREEFCKRTFDQIQRLIPYDAGAGLFDSRTTQLIVGVGLTESALDEYNSYYYRIQPWMTPEGTAKFAKMWRVNWREYDDSEFVTDYVRPNGLGFVMAEPTPRYFLGLSIHRSRWVSEFSDRERDILAVVNPHLTNMYRLHDRLSRGSHASQDEMAERFPSLSRRESEGFALLFDGLSASEIATHLFIGERTVESHMQAIYAKLNVHSRRQAIEKLSWES